MIWRYFRENLDFSEKKQRKTGKIRRNLGFYAVFGGKLGILKQENFGKNGDFAGEIRCQYGNCVEI